MQKSFLIIAVAFFTFCFGPAFAQQLYFSQEFDNSSGLSNSCINNIFQDSDHLLWLGTWDGLNVYDGNSFRVFNYLQNNSSHSIGNNVIYQILEDKHHNIWMRTNEGISEFNKRLGSFKHFFYDKSKISRNLTQGYYIAVDRNGTIFSVSKFGEDIRYFDDTSESFKNCYAGVLNAQEVTKMLFDDANSLWILKQNGELLMYKVKGTNLEFKKQYSNPGGIANMFWVNYRLFYLSGLHDLYQFDTNSAFRKICKLSHSVRDMAFYKKHYLLAWSSKGLSEYSDRFEPVNVLIDQVSSLKDTRITSLLTGGEENLWVGTDGGGVIKISAKENHFGAITKFPDGASMNIPVRAFTEVNGAIWAGTKGNGIISISDIGKRKSQFTVYRCFHSASDLLDNCVYALYNSGSYVYIGSDAPGITLYDCNSKRFIDWKDIKGTNQISQFNSVHTILCDRDSSVWLGTEGFGLIHLKLTETSPGKLSISYFHRYTAEDGTGGPGNDVIYTLAQGSNDMIWVGCRYGGLSVYNKVTGKFKTFKAFTYSGSLSNNDILSLYADHENRLWIGTSFGLNWISPKDINSAKPVFNKITTDNGLPNNTVHAISQDDRGYLWVSTNKGLARINPDSKRMVYFKNEDGLQSNEFSDGAVWKSKLGQLFFGGIKGFNYFQPESIYIDQEQPNLLLTDFQLADQQINENMFLVLSPGMKNFKNFILDRNNNFFDFKIKPIKFSNQEKCQYSYFLEGYDKFWHYLGEDKRISYTNIPPGNYNLKIRWSSGESGSNTEITAFHIQIKNYLWLTFPAFVAYLLFACAGFYIYYRYRRNKIILWHKLAMEHMLREKDEQQHRDQVNFFTNIAHELQTPLTLINGSLERYNHKEKGDEKVKQHFLSIISQQCSRLTYLIHQLLEFRKAEDGFLKPKYTYLNVSNLMVNITELFLPLADQKKHQVQIDIEPGISLWMDKDKVEKIMFNLLSNAFKHTEPNLQITCVVRALSDNEKLEILVSNNGRLSEDALQKMFSRFFTVEADQQDKLSSGIGLAYTKELVTLLNGSISVSSNDGWITFTVLLPLSIVPDDISKLDEYNDKPEQPSFFLKSLTTHQQKTDLNVITENNKRAIIKSLEGEQKKTILIIEDEPGIRFLLKDILQDNYIIYEADNGRDSLTLMDKIVPDLIISDIMMPDMNGLEVCNIVKNNPKFCHVPFVILSARSSVEQQIEGYETGADAYIPKPFDSEHLLVRVKRLLEYQQTLHNLLKRDDIVSQIPDGGMKHEDKVFLERTINLIEQNMENESLDAQFLERELNMSKAHFYRRLKSISGMTPGELIKSIRLQHAALLLQNSDYTVLEIFYKTGFNNQSHFFREFKKKYETSPNDYRDRFKLQVD